MPVNTKAECREALKRIEELSDATKGSAEEAKAVGLIDPVNAFRISSRTQANDNLAQAIGSPGGL